MEEVKVLKIRAYQSNDYNEITHLFYNTVHSINIKDYTKAQLDVWATGTVDITIWKKSLMQNHTVVCIKDGIIVGFGDLDSTGYFDRLYVHKDYQGEGIATAIANDIENYAIKNELLLITTHASITAKHFFEQRGYKIIKGQQVERKGIKLTNFVMEKIIGGIIL